MVFLRNVLIVMLLLSTHVALASDGLIKVKSHYSVQQTADRLVAKLQAKGMTVFARVNHSLGAEKVGLKLRPTELIVFGNPKVGTLFMQCQQTAGIDLPQKMLIWKDPQGQVWLTYNTPTYIAKRHHIMDCADQSVQKMTTALNKFAQLATQK